jgi:hypothetical protein
VGSGGGAIDWSVDAVAELERRAAYPPKESRRPRLQNRGDYFRAGLTYSVVSSGRISVRLLPEGWIFGHTGERDLPRGHDAVGAEIRAARDEVRRFYASVGRVDPQAASV